MQVTECGIAEFRANMSSYINCAYYGISDIALQSHGTTCAVVVGVNRFSPPAELKIKEISSAHFRNNKCIAYRMTDLFNNAGRAQVVLLTKNGKPWVYFLSHYQYEQSFGL